MQNSSLHIKVTPEIAKGLKVLSGKRSTSVGKLVRQAILSCYQLEWLDLGEKQRRALEAFQGGYISMGKLAEEMGMSVWELRTWLKEHEIAPNTPFQESDVSNA